MAKWSLKYDPLKNCYHFCYRDIPVVPLCRKRIEEIIDPTWKAVITASSDNSIALGVRQWYDGRQTTAMSLQLKPCLCFSTCRVINVEWGSDTTEWWQFTREEMAQNRFIEEWKRDFMDDIGRSTWYPRTMFSSSLKLHFYVFPKPKSLPAPHGRV